jgi:hypothetical protein
MQIAEVRMQNAIWKIADGRIQIAELLSPQALIDCRSTLRAEG